MDSGQEVSTQAETHESAAHETASIPLPSEGAAHGPLHKAKCPECGRTVPDRNGWCMYCGAELIRQQTTTEARTQATADEVDRKFLEEDVRPAEPVREEEQVREQEREGPRQTYKDRLSDL